jgi:hypothetical protein
MDAETVARTIQLIVAPAAMLTACAILAGAFIARYAAITDRLRALTRERWSALRDAREPLGRERVRTIDAQLPDLINHHRWMRRAVLALFLASAMFVMDMLWIALAASAGWAGAVNIALAWFIFSTVLLLISLLSAAREIWSSQRALYFEVGRARDSQPASGNLP